MTPEPTDLDALDALERAASHDEEWPEWYVVMDTRIGIGRDIWPLGVWNDAADAQLIVALRNAYPALSAELRAAREVVEAARAMFATWATPGVNIPHWTDLYAALATYDTTTGAQ